MQRGYFKGKVLNPSSAEVMQTETPAGSRHVIKHKRLSLDEKVAVVHAVLVQHLKHADVAKEHRVRTSVVSILVNKAKKKPTFLKELLYKD